jgi:hypothetical protein
MTFEERRKMMTPEQRLDRLERIVKLMIRAGLRERKDTREKINALIDAQMRTEGAMASLASAQAHLSRTQAELARDHANTDDKLNGLINTVESLNSENRKGEP